MYKNKNENNLIGQLDDKALWEQLAPVLKGIIRHGTGNADELIKKSQAAAAMTMIQSLLSDKDDVKLRAATELLNRSLGKPVERKIDIYANLNDVTDQELDTRLKTLLAETDQGSIIDAVFEAVPAMVKSKRKNRQIKIKQIPKKIANEREAGQVESGTGPTEPGAEA